MQVQSLPALGIIVTKGTGICALAWREFSRVVKKLGRVQTRHPAAGCGLAVPDISTEVSSAICSGAITTTRWPVSSLIRFMTDYAAAR
jgi:hypothetical protein